MVGCLGGGLIGWWVVWMVLGGNGGFLEYGGASVVISGD